MFAVVFMVLGVLIHDTVFLVVGSGYVGFAFALWRTSHVVSALRGANRTLIDANRQLLDANDKLRRMADFYAGRENADQN